MGKQSQIVSEISSTLPSEGRQKWENCMSECLNFYDCVTCNKGPNGGGTSTISCEGSPPNGLDIEKPYTGREGDTPPYWLKWLRNQPGQIKPTVTPGDNGYGVFTVANCPSCKVITPDGNPCTSVQGGANGNWGHFKQGPNPCVNDCVRPTCLNICGGPPAGTSPSVETDPFRRYAPRRATQ